MKSMDDKGETNAVRGRDSADTPLPVATCVSGCFR